MRDDNTTAGLSVLAAHTADVRKWYMQNDLQLNQGRSQEFDLGGYK